MSIHELKKEPHWSYSALQCYLTCPMKYKFRYVDNAPVERTCSALPFGRAFHAALSERARVGMDLKLSDTKDIFADFFKVESTKLLQWSVIRSKRNCTGMELPIPRVLPLEISRISPVKGIGQEPRIMAKTKARVRKTLPPRPSRSSICWISPGTTA